MTLFLNPDGNTIETVEDRIPLHISLLPNLDDSAIQEPPASRVGNVDRMAVESDDGSELDSDSDPLVTWDAVREAMDDVVSEDDETVQRTFPLGTRNPDVDPHNIPLPDVNALDAIPADWDLQYDDYKTVHHPHSKLSTTVCRFEDYSPHEDTSASNKEDAPETDKTPWSPFRTRLDFEFAELIQECRMNKPQTDRLIKLISTALDSPEQFQLIDEEDLAKTWESARDIHVSKVCVSIYASIPVFTLPASSLVTSRFSVSTFPFQTLTKIAPISSTRCGLDLP